MLPVIANVHRVTLDWDILGGINVRNVLNVSSTGTASQVATAFNAHLNNSMFDCVSTAQHLNELTIIPLDGVTPGQQFQLAAGPFSGAGGGDSLPQVCCVASIHTGQRGSRGRGRLFLGMVTEDKVSAAGISTTSRSTMASAWATFATALAAGSPSVLLGVASYVHADWHAMTSMRFDQVSGTQRRRNDQLR